VNDTENTKEKLSDPNSTYLKVAARTKEESLDSKDSSNDTDEPSNGEQFLPGGEDLSGLADCLVLNISLR
jgi:hypothetical protein